MTKLTFANKNIIMMEGYKIGDALPARAPSLKVAAQMAVSEINNGTTSDSAVTGVEEMGDLKNVSFQNGALLTVPSDYDIVSYKHALEVVVKEISD